jgi:hypothetical protein
METSGQYWKNNRYHPGTLIGGSTMNEVQLEDEIYDDALSRSYDHSCQAQNVTMVVSCDLEGAKSDQDKICHAKRIYWRPRLLRDWFSDTCKNFIVYQGLEDYSGSPGGAVATMLLLANILPDAESKENTTRGTCALEFERNVIFSERINLKTSELPRWKPSVIIGKNIIEENDAQ